MTDEQRHHDEAIRAAGLKAIRAAALDRYACAALTGFCAHLDRAEISAADLAEWAWNQADAMLAEAERRAALTETP